MPTIEQLPSPITASSADLLPIVQSDGNMHQITPGAMVILASGSTTTQTLTQIGGVANAALSLSQAQSNFAAINGSPSEVFNVANATSSTEATPLAQVRTLIASSALSLSQARSNFAAINGSPSEVFNVANATSSTEATPLAQVQTLIASSALSLSQAQATTNGSSSEVFNVPTAATATQATPLAQVQSLIASSTLMSVKTYGAKGDGVTDDTAAITNADAAARQAGAQLFFPAGVYMASQIVIYTGSNWIGEGRATGMNNTVWTQPTGGTILRQIIGSNVDFIYGNNSDSNWGVASPTTFVNGYTLKNLTVDGNWNSGAGNTSGNGVAIYGCLPVIENVYITNVAQNGLRTGWVVSNTAPIPGFGTFTMEGFYSNIKIDTVGEHGWWDAGPHDSLATAIIIIDASRAASNTYDSYYSDIGGDIAFVDFHGWTRHASAGGATVFSQYSANLKGGNARFANSQFEGAYSACVNINTGGNIFASDCMYYGANNGVTIFMGGTDCTSNLIEGIVGGPAVNAVASVGVQISSNSGDYVANNVINLICDSQENGNIAFGTANAGRNIIKIKASNNTAVTYYGTPSTEDDFYISGYNSNGNYAISNNWRQASRTFASGVGVVSESLANITSLALDAGTWEVWGSALGVLGSGSTMSAFIACVSISASSVPIGVSGLTRQYYTNFATGNGTDANVLEAGHAVINLETAGAIYLNVEAIFNGTLTCGGEIQAKRLV